MDGRRNFLKTAFATCSLLAGSKLLTACTPIKKVATDEETFETFATPDALKGMPIKATFLDGYSPCTCCIEIINSGFQVLKNRFHVQR